MILPKNSTSESSLYDSMSYSCHSTDSALESQFHQYRPNEGESTQPHHQLRQPRVAFNNEKTPLQRTQKVLPMRPPPLALQQNPTLQQQLQQKQEMSHEMQTAATMSPIAHNLIPQHTSAQITTAKASATIFSSVDLAVENVIPGIYLTKNFIAWNEENLRSHGFTHIIIIDKHIQELYYPSPVFKFATENTKVDAFDSYEYISHPACVSSLKFGKEFEAIDLNFGEKSYLTTVLPNCYRAVKFINKALQGGGTILVIDCNGGEQKCITIIVAYLMYKYNIKFSNAFARLKDYYKKADLDRFYMTQLYEYEPILQVQRAQSRGQSCSREMNSALLKRKKNVNDVGGDSSGNSCSGGAHACCSNNVVNLADHITKTRSTNDFLNNFNPLSNFNSTTSEELNLKTSNNRSNSNLQKLKYHPLNAASSLQQSSIYCEYQDETQPTDFSISGATDSAVDFHTWDDSAME